MLIMIFTMLIVLVLAAGVITVVVMGMEGTGRSQHPDIADAMARTARHLNGEGEPPRALVAVFDEMDEVGDLNVRELPGKLRTAASAASAASARSARSAWSSLSARSAASANPPAEVEGEIEGEVEGVVIEPELPPVELPAPESTVQDETEQDAPDEADHEEGGHDEGDHEEADHEPIVVEVPDVDEAAAQEMAAALAAPADEDLIEDDPYGVLSLPDDLGAVDSDGKGDTDGMGDADDLGDVDSMGDTVIRVRLPEGTSSS